MLRQLIFDDMKPALGVTEPGAIALACAKARSLSAEPVESVTVRANSGIYKNAFSCSIPATDVVGNEFSAALGVICGDAEKGLCALEGVTPADVDAARAMIAQGRVRAEVDSVSSELFIEATVNTAHDVCVATLRGSHTNFCLIKRNGEVLFEKPCQAGEVHESPIVHHGLKDFVDFANSASLDELLFMRDAHAMNYGLAETALSWERCTMTRSLLRDNGGKVISEDVLKTAKLLAGAAAEARILGVDKPAMSITGSGTHGIICTMPLYAAYKVGGLSEETLLRATAVSYLVTMYIKEFSGKLSAFCGCGIAGGTGMACALAYMQGADVQTIERVMNNMAASIVGMICTGGNHCCIMKVVSAVETAFTALRFALDGAYIGPEHGICGDSPEKTARNIGLIASPGMVETERVILDIIRSK